MNEGKINNPRAEIDAIDSELLRLLNRRAEIALRVGAVKTSDDTSLCDPNREREVLSRLSKENPGPFDEKGIANIFQRIIDESLHLQQKTYHKPLENSGRTTAETALLAGKSRVAFLGERGTFSEEAALGILGEDCQTVSFPTFEDLFRAIDEGKADYILTPLENSLVG
ncbi:MAG: chorismate mutase, partial [Acidobacteriota bacterium]|nr:chorismate mutase [Acidobacteriota bacterium]